MSNSLENPVAVEIPAYLGQINPPVGQLYAQGNVELLNAVASLAVIGSRRCSPYGRQVTTRLVQELARTGVVIVSGLAMGIDGIAHEAALEVDGRTIAVLPCGIDTVYPRSHHYLAQHILDSGGLLISEYRGTELPMKHQFIARNRIIAGLSKGVLITEAASRSGSLHTAAFALEQGKPVFAVPGNITSVTSGGTNQLVKTGAITVTEAKDILEPMGWTMPLQARIVPRGRTETEQLIIDLLVSGIQDMELLLANSGLNPADFNQTLTMLEISGRVRALGMGQWELL